MMCQLRTIAIGLGLLAGIACQHSSPREALDDASGGPASAATAATVDGRTITVGDLDAYIMRALFDEATSERNPASLYEVRAQNLERMIDEIIIEQAAAAANLSPEEYLDQRVEAEGEIPEDEIAAFYDEHMDQMGGMAFDQIKDRIAAFLLEQRALAVVAELRDHSETQIFLEPARIQVEAIGPSKGPEDAIVTIVEFSDFQCPYCQRVAPTIEQVVAKYPNEVRFVFRNLPLNNIHPRAQAAAEAAACAHRQGSFWGYHDLIFANNQALTDEDLERHASRLGLEMQAFRQCVQNRETRSIVDADIAAAESLQISGTPSFLINGIPKHGAQSLDSLSAVIDAEIARAASGDSGASR